MLKGCLVCKVFGALAVIGAINWGLVGLLGINVVEQIFGVATLLTRVIYILVGISGLALLASFFKMCPACNKTCNKPQ